MVSHAQILPRSIEAEPHSFVFNTKKSREVHKTMLDVLYD